MHSDGFTAYLRQVAVFIERAELQAGTTIPAAAEIIAAAIAAGRVLRVFGASHAGILAQDLFYRSGGLVAIDPILPGGLMLNERPVTRTSHLERLPGYADVILKESPLGPGDVLLVISVSGRNAVGVEMASIARESGATVVALTNLEYSRSVTARSGAKRLYEVADIVIDLPGVRGDAAVTLEGVANPVGPTSTAVGSAILQGLMVEVVRQLQLRGFDPPVLLSGNLDGADEQNARLLELYRQRLSYL